MPRFCRMTIDVVGSVDIAQIPMLMAKFLCYDAVIAACEPLLSPPSLRRLGRRWERDDRLLAVDSGAKGRGRYAGTVDQQAAGDPGVPEVSTEDPQLPTDRSRNWRSSRPLLQLNGSEPPQHPGA